MRLTRSRSKPKEQNVGRVMSLGRLLLYLATLAALGIVFAASATAHVAQAF
jgi:hypothetical protein